MSVIARLVIKGFVQGIGYRAYVKQSAYRLKVKGTVKNLSDGSVEIYCNASDEEIYDKFKELLKSGVGEIEDIEEHLEGSEDYGEGPKEWIGFNYVRDEYGSMEETLDYVVLGGREMLEMQKETLYAIKGMDGNIKDMNKDLNEKHDKDLDAIHAMDQHMNEKFDWLADRYGEFGHKMERLEQDIHEMKDAFIKLVDHFVKDNE